MLERSVATGGWEEDDDVVTKCLSRTLAETKCQIYEVCGGDDDIEKNNNNYNKVYDL